MPSRMKRSSSMPTRSHTSSTAISTKAIQPWSRKMACWQKPTRHMKLNLSSLTRGKVQWSVHHTQMAEMSRAIHHSSKRYKYLRISAVKMSGNFQIPDQQEVPNPIHVPRPDTQREEKTPAKMAERSQQFPLKGRAVPKTPEPPSVLHRSTRQRKTPNRLDL